MNKPRPSSERPLNLRPFSSNKRSSDLPVKSFPDTKPKEKSFNPSKKEIFPNPLSEKNMHQLIEFPITYRIAHPAKSNYLVSLDFWKENSQNNKSLTNQNKRPQSSIERGFLRGLSLPKPVQPYEELFQIGAQNVNSNVMYQRLTYENEKPFSFLSSLGGKKTSFDQITSIRTEENMNHLPKTDEDFEDVAKAIQQFSKLDMDKSMKTQFTRQKSSKSRPMTVTSGHFLQISGQFRVGSAILKQDKRLPSGLPMIKKPLETDNPRVRPLTAMLEKANLKPKTLSATNRGFSARNQVSYNKKAPIQSQIVEKNLEFFDDELDIREDFEENDDFYEKAEKIQGLTLKTRPKSNLLTSRPISGRSAAPEQFFNIFTKYAKFNDIELPYEDLFDRNERTIAATYAKFGDLGYYSPVQRIGAYMQFGAKLKREHLIEIINLQKTSNN